MDIEIWKPVIYRNIKRDMYEVSNMGRVRNKLTGHIMTQCLSEKGYPMTIFRCDDGKSRSIKTHRVVAWHFVDGRTDIKNEVDHVDGDKTNNKSLNLEWVTREENIRRGFDKGLIPVLRGSKNGNTTLTDEDVRTICSLLVYYCGNCKKVFQVSKYFGVHTNIGRIHDIKYKKVWAWISDEYFTRESIDLIKKLSTKLVEEICLLIYKHDGDSNAVVEDLYCEGINYIDENIVRNIRDGNFWKHISRRIYNEMIV